MRLGGVDVCVHELWGGGGVRGCLWLGVCLQVLGNTVFCLRVAHGMQLIATRLAYHVDRGAVYSTRRHCQCYPATLVTSNNY